MNNQDQEITIIEIKNKFISEYLFLKSKIKILFYASFLCAIIALSYVYFKPIKYSAQLTFALEDDKGAAGAGLSGISGAAGLASQFGIDLGNESIKIKIVQKLISIDDINQNESKHSLRNYINNLLR